MKKFIILVACIVCAACATAQTKVAYLDLYQRGGARHLRTTLMFNDTKMWCGKMTLGKALNMLAEDGWIVDQTLIGANRVGCAFVFTRHKFHIILKKEYQQGENPFEKLSARGRMAQNTPISEINVSKIKSEMAILSKEIRIKYYALKKSPNSIPDNINEFESKVGEYVNKYELLYNRYAPKYLPEICYLESLRQIASKIK